MIRKTTICRKSLNTSKKSKGGSVPDSVVDGAKRLLIIASVSILTLPFNIYVYNNLLVLSFFEFYYLLSFCASPIFSVMRFIIIIDMFIFNSIDSFQNLHAHMVGLFMLFYFCLEEKSWMPFLWIFTNILVTCCSMDPTSTNPPLKWIQEGH